MIQRVLRRWWSPGSVVKSAFYNYALHISRYIMPLVVMPYLSRSLGAEKYGLVFLTLSFGAILTLFIEFGFSLSATRELSKHRDSSAEVDRILSQVFGAKCLLALGATILGLCALLVVPRLRENIDFVWLGLPYAFAYGMSPMWYYQAVEKMRTQSAIEIFCQMSAMAFVFIIVHEPGEAKMVPILQISGAALSSILGYRILYRSARFEVPEFSACIEAIRLGLSMFAFRGFLTLYTTANLFIVGVLLPSSQVTYYGTAEKLFTAVTALFGPFSQTVFPRMNYLLKKDPIRALALAKIGFILVLSASVVATVLGWLLAPELVRLLFGKEFMPSSHILRVMLLALPLIGVSQILGIQCLLPLKMDKIFNSIIFSAAIVNVVMGLVTTPYFGPQGMAWSRVATEAIVTVAMASYLIARRNLVMDKAFGI